MLKSENVRTLFLQAAGAAPEAVDLDLAQKCIASSKELHRIQIKMTSVKHVNTAIVCQSLGAAYWRREDLLIRAKQ